MKDIHHYGYFPLTEHTVRSWVPPTSGLYMLAHTEDGKQFRNFHASYSDDLLAALTHHLRERSVVAGLSDPRPPVCYFAFVILGNDDESIHAVGKLFTQTVDPVKSLAVVACN